eukprot:UN01096
MQQQSTGRVVGQRYREIRKIGCGSFGSIYLGISNQSGEEVAIKREQVSTKHPQIAYEAKLYRLFQAKCRSPPMGIPQFRWFGVDSNDYALVIDLLGPSLEDLFNFCNRKFSLKTTLMLADQLIFRCEFVHTRNYVHRDIKPDNFLIGLGKKENIVHIIDFGLAKRYRDPRSMEHIGYSENKSLTGTARYASVHTHLGREQSRRDDLESLGYVLMYFVRGNLPWQGLQATTKREKYDRISEKKITTSFDQLCKNYPHEFVDYFKYVRQLAFDEKPNYHYMRSLFRDLFDRKGYQHDFMFDWSILNFFGKFLYMTPTSNATRQYHTQSVQQIQQEQIQLQLQQQQQQQQQAQQQQPQDYVEGPPTQAQHTAQQYMNNQRQ